MCWTEWRCIQGGLQCRGCNLDNLDNLEIHETARRITSGGDLENGAHPAFKQRRGGWPRQTKKVQGMLDDCFLDLTHLPTWVQKPPDKSPVCEARRRSCMLAAPSPSRLFESVLLLDIVSEPKPPAISPVSDARRSAAHVVSSPALSAVEARGGCWGAPPPPLGHPSNTAAKHEPNVFLSAAAQLRKAVATHITIRAVNRQWNFLKIGCSVGTPPRRCLAGTSCFETTLNRHECPCPSPLTPPPPPRPTRLPHLPPQPAAPPPSHGTPFCVSSSAAPGDPRSSTPRSDSRNNVRTL